MTDKTDYEEILLDLPPERIIEVIELHSRLIIDEPSRTFIKDAIKAHQEDGKPISTVFEGFGRAMFNSILVMATMEYIENHWKDCWPDEEKGNKEEEDDNTPTNGD